MKARRNEMELDIKSVKKAYTHGGIFHADDVFSTAFLQILNPHLQVTRGLEVPENFDGIVYDIGGREFDHHQNDSRVRENGVPYAAFGLLWEAFGDLVLTKEDLSDFDEDFIQPIDLSDNTGVHHPIAEAISNFNPIWTEEDTADRDACFMEAVAFAKGILERKFAYINANRQAYDLVVAQMERSQDGILELERSLPWKDAVKNTDLIYVIYPSIRGGYNVQTVKKDDESNQEKLPFPEEWRGKRDEELQAVSGIDTARFCHNSGFLFVTDTLEDAWKVARLSIEKQR